VWVYGTIKHDGEKIGTHAEFQEKICRATKAVPDHFAAGPLGAVVRELYARLPALQIEGDARRQAGASLQSLTVLHQAAAQRERQARRAVHEESRVGSRRTALASEIVALHAQKILAILDERRARRRWDFYRRTGRWL
jgi:hypothetical protein